MWSWKITPEELKEQVENYNTLKITQSYRGISVLIVGALLLLSLVLAFFGLFSSVSDIILSLVLYVPILFFVYKGHRWAIVSLLVLWTLEKAYTLYLSVDMGSTPISSIIWWLIVAPYIYKALVVENARIKNKQNPSVEVEGIYCTKCGTRQAKDSKFCTKCGNQLSSVL